MSFRVEGVRFPVTLGEPFLEWKGSKYELRQETQLAVQRSSWSRLNSPKAYKQVYTYQATIKPQSEAMTAETTESQPRTVIDQSVQPSINQSNTATAESSAQQYETSHQSNT